MIREALSRVELFARSPRVHPSELRLRIRIRKPRMRIGQEEKEENRVLE
jgi:hypothetical protein